MLIICPCAFLKSDGGNPDFSYFTTLLTVCAVTAMIWLGLCQVGKFWVETCSLLFIKAWVSVLTHMLIYGRKDFLWFIKSHKLYFESWCQWWMKYWESNTKKKSGIPGEDWAPLSMGNSSAMTVAQHVVTCFFSPYVPSLQCPINPFLDARKKNDLSKLWELPIPCISSVTDNLL